MHCYLKNDDGDDGRATWFQSYWKNVSCTTIAIKYFKNADLTILLHDSKVLEIDL